MYKRERQHKAKMAAKKSSRFSEGIMGLSFQRRNQQEAARERNRSNPRLYKDLHRHYRHRGRMPTEAPEVTAAQKPTEVSQIYLYSRKVM